MKQHNKFSIHSRFRSFKFALNGIYELFKTEHNAWIHLLATILILCLGIYFHISKIEWGFLIFAIGIVFIAEIINTSIEKLTDLVSPESHPLAKKTKDLAAGGVLIASFLAICIGILIFGAKMI